MKSVIGVVVIAIAFLIAARFSFVHSPAIARAEPLAQTTATPRPTDEPTKSPYVFPTPIFIPTFPPDTPAPIATRVTPTPLPAGTQTYTVESGDSPWTIAGKVYGDPTKFRLIMDANGITDQTRLRRGQVLKIPPLTPIASATATILPTPTLAPTLAPLPTATAARLPTPTPTSAPTPADPVQIALTIISGILLIASLGAGALAYMTFRRAQRLPPVRPLQLPRAIPSPPETLKK